MLWEPIAQAQTPGRWQRVTSSAQAGVLMQEVSSNKKLLKDKGFDDTL